MEEKLQMLRGLVAQPIENNCDSCPSQADLRQTFVRLATTSNGLQPKSNGLQPKSDGLQPTY